MSGGVAAGFAESASENCSRPPDIFGKFKKLVYSGDEDDQNAQIPPADFDDLEPASENCSRISPDTVLSFLLDVFRLEFRVYHLGYGPDIFGKFKKLVYSGDEDDQNAQIPPADFDDLERDEPENWYARAARDLRLNRANRSRRRRFSPTSGPPAWSFFMEIVRVTDLPPERNGMDYLPACKPLNVNWCYSNTDIEQFP
jgi:hypothetical protein